MKDAFAVKLGSLVRDQVTGLEGIATSRTEYLNGCVQYGVSPKAKEDGTLPDAMGFDWQRVEVVGDGVAASYEQNKESQTREAHGDRPRTGGPDKRLSARG